MRRGTFPDPLTYDYPEWVSFGDYLYRSHDIVAFGVPLTVDNVREAYLSGIFPWHTDGIPLPWHCPERRAILEFASLRIPRSLAKARRSTSLTFTIDTAFRRVMRECALAHRPGQFGTWITPEFERVFTDLHEQGMAHSVEAWDTDGRLAGGLYGVDAGGVFCGESMFYKMPNASKLALLFLVDHLQSRGATWLDNQVMTPHFELLGASEIGRHNFLAKLRSTQLEGHTLFHSE
ncbi:MAG TPA: leucyl/phenylalanyl-tRNA--protein transferase [Pyrinomonadaceae bacterium]|nr:leucyl/phenylalanyl-tRNA--protein transferase [Pyrinomonadaceae bacterium]